MNRNTMTAAMPLMGLLALAQAASAQSYSFSKVGDSSTDDFDAFSSGNPSISNAGYVAFGSQTSDQRNFVILRSGAGLATPLQRVADTSVNTEVLAFYKQVGVNNAGEVSMWSTIFGPVGERISRASGGLLKTITQTSPGDPFNFLSVITSLNDQGTVVWQGEINEPGFPQGLFIGDGLTTTTIFSTASSQFTSSFAGPDINNAGQIAFRASTLTSDGDAIFRYDGGTNFVTIVDSTGPFSAAFDDEPSISSNGKVAVIGYSDDMSVNYVIVGDGTSPAAPVADSNGDLESFSAVSVNDSGDVAFLALYDDFENQGIFTGPDLVNDRIIRTGDSLDGSVVMSLGFYRDGLNDEGQIAFVARLEDGRAVVMVASPVFMCYPDCDLDGLFTIDDFICFQTLFAIGDPYADCDSDAALTIDDFICFQTFFAIGC